MFNPLQIIYCTQTQLLEEYEHNLVWCKCDRGGWSDWISLKSADKAKLCTYRWKVDASCKVAKSRAQLFKLRKPKAQNKHGRGELNGREAQATAIPKLQKSCKREPRLEDNNIRTLRRTPNRKPSSIQNKHHPWRQTTKKKPTPQKKTAKHKTTHHPRKHIKAGTQDALNSTIKDTSCSITCSSQDISSTGPAHSAFSR